MRAFVLVQSVSVLLCTLLTIRKTQNITGLILKTRTMSAQLYSTSFITQRLQIRRGSLTHSCALTSHTHTHTHTHTYSMLSERETEVASVRLQIVLSLINVQQGKRSELRADAGAAASLRIK